MIGYDGLELVLRHAARNNDVPWLAGGQPSRLELPCRQPECGRVVVGAAGLGTGVPSGISCFLIVFWVVFWGSDQTCQRDRDTSVVGGQTLVIPLTPL